MAQATKAKAGGNPEQDTTKTEAKKATPVAILTLNKGALSTEVGPAMLKAYALSFENEQKAHDILNEIEAKRYDVLANTTQAIVKAAKSDKAVNLAAAFGQDTAEKNKLSKMIDLALGLQVYETVTTTGGSSQVLRTNPAIASYFPTKTDDKDAPATKRKATFRTNWAHLKTKCIQAAHGIISADITVKKDEKSGTLLLSGPAIQKEFGQDQVLLNEKQTIPDPKNKENSVQLKVKPSFTQVARIGAAAEGKVVEIRKDSRAQTATIDADTAVQSQCSQLIASLGKLEKPNDKTLASLNSLASAIAKRLGK